MTDPISLTAAAAGFIGLAGQLAQGVIKVKEIYTTINDAPRDVASLCTKMDLLQATLEEVGDQIQQLSQGNIKLDTRSLQGVISQCETSRHRVAAHVRNFSDGFRRNKGAAMKYVFKKKEIQEMMSDVEQCKSSLIIARQSIDGAISFHRHQVLLQQHATLLTNNHRLLQQTSRVEAIVEAVSSQQQLDFDASSQQSVMASERSAHGYRSLRDAHQESSSKISESLRGLKNQLHSQHDMGSSTVMLARIEDIQRDIHASNRHLEQLVSRRSNDSHLNSARTTKRVKVGFQSMLFSFSVEFSSETENQENTKGKTVASAVKKSICTIRLPNWFVQDQYNLAIARSKNGWMFQPSVYRIVDRNSMFFEACVDGDLETMRMLLTTKQAYLGDRSVSGNFTSGPDSGLSLALFYKQFEACELLVNAGILSSFQAPDYAEALGNLAYNSRSDRNEAREILRLIELNQNLDPGWDGDVEIGSDYCKAIQDLRLYAEEAGDSALDRYEALIFPTTLARYCDNLESELHSLSEFLGDADHLQEIRATASRSTWLLFALADKVGSLFSRNDFGSPPEHAVQAFRLALGAICDAELDLHAFMSQLPSAWDRALFSTHWLYSDDRDCITPFAYIFAYHVDTYGSGEKSYCPFDRLNAAMRLWVNTIHSAGVDLAAYAGREVWKINRILLKARAQYDFTCRLLHGPEPDDWRIETGPAGEAYPAYFWRGAEAAPIVEELAVKVLVLMHQVKHPETVLCNVPGGWELDWDGLNESDWIIKGWLTFMEDSKLAQMEADLERLDAKEFCEVWDLSSLLKYWSYDKEDSEGHPDK